MEGTWVGLSAPAMPCAGRLPAGIAAAYDVEVTNLATNLDFYWYKAQLRRSSP